MIMKKENVRRKSVESENDFTIVFSFEVRNHNCPLKVKLFFAPQEAGDFCSKGNDVQHVFIILIIHFLIKLNIRYKGSQENDFLISLKHQIRKQDFNFFYPLAYERNVEKAAVSILKNMLNMKSFGKVLGNNGICNVLAISFSFKFLPVSIKSKLCNRDEGT